MIEHEAATIWLVIGLLGLGTLLLRFSFLGLMGGREPSRWLMRLLRYVPVAVLPALTAPLVVWPQATGGTIDPPRLLAAIIALLVGVLTRSLLWAVISGFAALYLGLTLLG